MVSATVGAVGFCADTARTRGRKRVALANKETLVMAGELMTAGGARVRCCSYCRLIRNTTRCTSVCAAKSNLEVRRIILTASGGPFRTKTKTQMQESTVSEALRHPTWSMGAKITIDSATLMNKGLEVIEAHWLFGLRPDQIDIVVHPESVVHSMIELVDGSVIAQMGVTDMRHAIQYALTYPRPADSELPPLDLTALSALHFEPPDPDRFPCHRAGLSRAACWRHLAGRNERR